MIEIGLSTRLMKNWQVAELGSFVRAMAIVPRLFQAVARLVLDRGPLAFLLLLHLIRHPAPLDHEAGDDAVEDQVVVEPVVDVLEEVLDGDRGLVRVELEGDRPRGGVEHDDRASRSWPCAGDGARRKGTLPGREPRA